MQGRPRMRRGSFEKQWDGGVAAAEEQKLKTWFNDMNSSKSLTAKSNDDGAFERGKWKRK